MKSTTRMLLLALGTVAFMLPASAAAQTSGVQIWTKRCGSCHAQQPANRYSAEKWESIMTHMALTARLPTEQADAVLEFLKSGAREVAMQEDASAAGLMVAAAGSTFLPETLGPEDVYKANCVPCHGRSGKGDGPAAQAFNPRPADLTDPEVVQNRSAEELVRLIADGGGGMPGFAATLSSRDIEEVAEYIRRL